MSTDPTIAELAPWQRDRLAVLLDTLDGVTISDAEWRSLEWLSGWERHTVENLAAVIGRARLSGPRPGSAYSPERGSSARRGVAAGGRRSRGALDAGRRARGGRRAPQ